ncbi:glycosyltransferase family 4 protein [Bacteroides sp. GD17]|jgi:glycosyltransferase involved in cell wall biosynthesis|uniref:glycosyltransferase family 4 protein n=1 Tax=Bacteroides sp. GD17 TaxID=3139826 RepID=UPI00313B1ED0
MKLGVYLEANYQFKNGDLYCSDIYTLLLNQLSFEYNLSFLGRITDDIEASLYSYKIVKYDKFYKVSTYRNLVCLCCKYLIYRYFNKKILEEFVESSDCLLIMTPSPISIDLIHIAQKYEKPMRLLVRQDTRAVIPQRFNGIKKILATCVANYLEHSVEMLTQKNDLTILALGPSIAKRYCNFTSKCSIFISSRYKINDIVPLSRIGNLSFNNTVNLLFVGRIEINKGLYELIIALSEQDYFNYHLTIVGDGTYKKEMINLVKRINLDNKVTLVGYKTYGEELLNIYRANDIFILPSYSEGLPQVILEAMASGCLVLSTSVGSIPYIINNRKNGVLFNPHSISSLISVFKELVTIDECELYRMRKLGLETARQYAYENQIDVLKYTL